MQNSNTKMRAFRGDNLYFIHAKVEEGAGDVPAAPLDSQENKYLFVRYIEKSENMELKGTGYFSVFH